MDIFQFLPVIFGGLIPTVLLLGAGFLLLAKPANVWPRACMFGLLALLSSALLLGMTAIDGPYGAFHDVLNLTYVSVSVLFVVSMIAYVVLRFSVRYMAGEPGQHRFAGLLLLAFAAVSVVIISNHLLLLIAAWMSVSLAMHQLLLFYPERPRAALAAHKKFIFARLAEISLFGAFVVLYLQHQTWVISDVMAYYRHSHIPLNAQEQFAMCLIALAVLIKSAQLPLHGWLIQVVEAPTPISAALHAGVINMGGFVLISFAPLFSLAIVAQWLVLVVAGVSTLIAALVMTTRVSVKVRLAWSTSAQIGLMLIECALGLYELALLHLVAHSLYKAYGFLNSGNAVHQNKTSRLSLERPPTVAKWLLAIVIASTFVVVCAYAASLMWIDTHDYIAPWLLLTLALVTLLAQRSSGHHVLNIIPHALLAMVLLVIYVLLKHTSGALFTVNTHIYSIWADAWVCLLLLGLFVGHYLQRYQLHRAWVQKINLALFSGLYIDEWSTRATLAVWPKSLPVRVNPKTMSANSKESLS